MEVDSAKKKRFRNEIENREFEIFRREKCKASRLVSAEFVGAIAILGFFIRSNEPLQRTFVIRFLRLLNSLVI